MLEITAREMLVISLAVFSEFLFLCLLTFALHFVYCFFFFKFRQGITGALRVLVYSCDM